MVLVFFFLVTTCQRNRVWSDEFTLWKDTTLKSPCNARSHMNLAIEYNEKGNTQRALQELERALELKPHDALIHNNFGIVYIKMEQYQPALKAFKEALKLTPHYSHAHYNLGTLYTHYQKYSDAIACFKKALSFKPLYPKAYNNLGMCTIFREGMMKRLSFVKRL